MNKQYSSEFKARVALEAVKGEQTLSELSQKYEVHHITISIDKTSEEKYFKTRVLLFGIQIKNV